MQPYRYTAQVAEVVDFLDDPEQINTIMDELEFLHEVVDPEFQDLASDLIARLQRRLQALSDA